MFNKLGSKKDMGDVPELVLDDITTLGSAYRTTVHCEPKPTVLGTRLWYKSEWHGSGQRRKTIEKFEFKNEATPGLS